MTPRVIGIGNAARGDDAVGHAVVEELRRRNLALELVTSDGDPAQLLELLDGIESVVIVDAVISKATPGTLCVRDLTAGPIPLDHTPSSHGLGLVEAVELARIFRQLPRDAWLVGVEGACFDQGAAMTPAVRAAIPVAADAIETGGFRCTSDP
jgi:hydrogenase maturation protease